MALPFIGPAIGAIGSGIGGLASGAGGLLAGAGGAGALQGAGSLIGPAIGAAGNIIAAGSNANAIGDANAASIAAQREANAANQQLFRESRGAPTADGQVSAVLPEFFNTPEGSFEAQLANEIINTFNSAPDVDPVLLAAQAGGDQLIGDVFSGKVAETRSGLADAVTQAERAGISAGLQETLGKIRATRARSGQGDSSFTTRAATAATAGARRAQGSAEAAREKALFDEDVALRLGLLDAPINRIRQQFAIPFANVDETLSRLGFFNIGPGQPPAQIPVPTTAVPGGGAAVGAGLSSFGNAIGDFYATQRIIDEIARQGISAAPAAIPVDPPLSSGPLIEV